ncbi:hypothetical protein F4809DRAFT_621626 [Biscogniauxia mediterranea]|nr:hypothetical protein F4809DRAFT_621626 [Biscogniauxia mediterranea]
MKSPSTLLLALLLPAAAVLAAPNLMQQGRRQDSASTTTTSSSTTTAATTTDTSDLPCPTAPDTCADREGGHLICLNSAVWCRYTDATRGTPAFFPVNLTAPCPSCLSSW